MASPEFRIEKETFNKNYSAETFEKNLIYLQNFSEIKFYKNLKSLQIFVKDFHSFVKQEV